MVVAPYNVAVRCIRDRRPRSASRVGTVDKFQGQEAPVVFFAMTSSTGEDVPRGMDFLFSAQPAQRRRLARAVPRRARPQPATARRRLLDASSRWHWSIGVLPLRRNGTRITSVAVACRSAISASRASTRTARRARARPRRSWPRARRRRRSRRSRRRCSTPGAGSVLVTRADAEARAALLEVAPDARRGRARAARLGGARRARGDRAS